MTEHPAAEHPSPVTPQTYWFAQGPLIHGPDNGGIDIGPLIGEARTDTDATALVRAHNAMMREGQDRLREALTALEGWAAIVIPMLRKAGDHEAASFGSDRIAQAQAARTTRRPLLDHLHTSCRPSENFCKCWDAPPSDTAILDSLARPVEEERK